MVGEASAVSLCYNIFLASVKVMQHFLASGLVCLVGREIPIFIFHLMGWGNYGGHLLPYASQGTRGVFRGEKEIKKNSCLHLSRGKLAAQEDEMTTEENVHSKT